MRSPCKLCYLKRGNMRPQVELIERLLLNKGHKDKPSKPLSYTQICYIAYIIFGISIERHTLQKHYTKCMGFEENKCPIHYNTQLREFVDQSGNIVPREEVKKYRRDRFIKYPRSDVKQTVS